MNMKSGDVAVKFDELIAAAESPDTKLLIAALKLQSAFLDSRLFQIENNTAYQMKKDRSESPYKLTGQ